MTKMTDVRICPECGQLNICRIDEAYHRYISQEEAYCRECGEELEAARLCSYCGDYHPVSAMDGDIEDMCKECFKDGVKRLGALTNASEDPCAIAVLDFLCAS